MKIKIIYLISLLIPFIWSCSNPSYQDFSAYSVTYSSHSKARGTNRIIEIEHTDPKSIVITRREAAKSTSDLWKMNDVLHLDTRNVEMDDKGIIYPKNNKMPIWLVPFSTETDPVLLTDNLKCIRYYCNCGGAAGESSTICEIRTSPEGVIYCRQAEGAICPYGDTGETFCIGVTATVLCNQASDLPFEYYTGGVIVEAENVKVINPLSQNMRKSNSAPLDFIVTENGEMYIKTEYEKYQEEKKNYKKQQ